MVFQYRKEKQKLGSVRESWRVKSLEREEK